SHKTPQSWRCLTSMTFASSYEVFANSFFAPCPGLVDEQSAHCTGDQELGCPILCNQNRWYQAAACRLASRRPRGQHRGFRPERQSFRKSKQESRSTPRRSPPDAVGSRLRSLDISSTRKPPEQYARQ